MADIAYIGPGGAGVLTPPGEPVPGIIETLERMLTLARDGELAAVAVAGVVIRSGIKSYDFEFAYRGGVLADLLASSECCKARVIEAIRNGS